jgi:hypothetical protein
MLLYDCAVFVCCLCVLLSCLFVFVLVVWLSGCMGTIRYLDYSRCSAQLEPEAASKLCTGTATLGDDGGRSFYLDLTRYFVERYTREMKGGGGGRGRG